MAKYEKYRVGFIVHGKVKNLRQLKNTYIIKIKYINGAGINPRAMKGTTKEKLIDLIYNRIEERIWDAIRRGSIKIIKFQPFYNYKYKHVDTYIEAEINIDIEKLVRDIIKKAQETYKRKKDMVDAIFDVLIRYFGISIPERDLEFFKYYNADDITFTIQNKTVKILAVFF